MTESDEATQSSDQPVTEERPSPPPVTEPIAEPIAEASPAPRDRRLLIAGTVAALCFILFLLSGPLGLWPSSVQLGGGDTPAQTRTKVETVSARFARNLVNFSYKTLDRDLDKVRADATGNFENEFKQALGGSTDVFRKAIRKAKATSTGNVKGTIISSQTSDNAVVIVYLTQSVSNAKSPKPRALPRFLQLTLVQSGSTWKVDDVKQLEISAQ